MKKKYRYKTIREFEIAYREFERGVTVALKHVITSSQAIILAHKKLSVSELRRLAIQNKHLIEELN
jgi:hypothetical protein